MFKYYLLILCFFYLFILAVDNVFVCEILIEYQDNVVFFRCLSAGKSNKNYLK